MLTGPSSALNGPAAAAEAEAEADAAADADAASDAEAAEAVAAEPTVLEEGAAPESETTAAAPPPADSGGGVGGVDGSDGSAGSSSSAPPGATFGTRSSQGLPELPRSGHDVEWLQLDSVLQVSAKRPNPLHPLLLEPALLSSGAWRVSATSASRRIASSSVRMAPARRAASTLQPSCSAQRPNSPPAPSPAAERAPVQARTQAHPLRPTMTMCARRSLLPVPCAPHSLLRPLALSSALAPCIGATLTHYQPDERERRRLRRAQHEDGGDSGEDSGGEDEWEDDEEHRRAFAQLRQQRGLDDMIARLPAVRFPFDRLVRAFALVGLSSDHRAADAARELQVHRDAERAEERERELTRCAAGFLAVHLNLNDLALLPGLREAYTRWRALNASLSAAATDAALAEQAEQAAASAIVDAKRLQLWLLADDWLCMASRLRGPGDTAPGLVNLRRENVQRHTDELRKLLDARATARRHRADGPSDGHLADRTSALHAEIAVLEQQLRDIYGLGAAFNNRVVEDSVVVVP